MTIVKVGILPAFRTVCLGFFEKQAKHERILILNAHAHIAKLLEPHQCPVQPNNQSRLSWRHDLNSRKLFWVQNLFSEASSPREQGFGLGRRDHADSSRHSPKLDEAAETEAAWVSFGSRLNKTPSCLAGASWQRRAEEGDGWRKGLKSYLDTQLILPRRAPLRMPLTGIAARGRSDRCFWTARRFWKEFGESYNATR
jgi:hypothetical protein